ncbi:MAG: hypothetical protein AB1717_08375 [Pseudomonadota bacterium]
MSLSYVDAPGEPLDMAELKRARLLHSLGDVSLGRYQLVYCHGNYTSTAVFYLSSCSGK